MHIFTSCQWRCWGLGFHVGLYGILLAIEAQVGPLLIIGGDIPPPREGQVLERHTSFSHLPRWYARCDKFKLAYMDRQFRKMRRRLSDG